MRLALIVLAILAAPGLAADPDGYARTVEPFFRDYCISCHAGEKAKGALDVTAKGLSADFADPAAAAKWKEIVNVLNSHSMPPKKAKQPDTKAVAAVVDWIVERTTQAELAKRERGTVLRRLNREEYRNTIRDLVGIDFDVSAFPQDPPAGGFDNNGGALTLSPLHIETYLNAARQILDRALVDGERPETIRWRFDPKVGDIDRTRVRVGKNNAIVNGGRNRQDGDWVVVHHESWDKHVGARDFVVPVAGNYIIRVKAAGTVPDRDAVVKSAEAILRKRRDDQNAKNPKGEKFTREQYERDLAHFKTDRMYGYGPPRAKLTLQLGPQPRTVAEFDADGAPDKPKIHEFPVRFTTERAGIGLEYAYAIPRVLENFWMQTGDAFARPELMIDWFEIEGPIFDAWPPSSHTGILFPSPTQGTDEAAYAREVLARFLRKSFRRPVSAEEIDAKLRHFTAARQDGAGFVEAIKRPLVTTLVSPNFLFLVEPARTNRTLTDHESAARLSYFVWSSQPDAELRRAADAGELKTPEQRMKQFDRMIADPKADAFTRNFAGQWLGLREVGNNPPAPDLYPQYDRHLEVSIVRESEAFFREILDRDLDARNLVKSDFVVVNERLARFYGIDGVSGDTFRRVAVPPSVHRGGIPTQASILTITSNGTRTSPVKRGTWILKTLLGIDPGLPVANAGEIAPKVPGIDKATVRKRLEIHRTLDQCARCHNKIDPLGFALENYNAAGEWRDREGFGYKGRVQANDPRIDARSEMIDGTTIDGVAGLQDAILRQEDLFLECLAGKVLTYALGREMGLADRPAVKAAVAAMKADGRTLKSLLRHVVGSEPFGSK
jgi:mono/diheme cytochrome c family protein